MRRFIRHPTDIPIALKVMNAATDGNSYSKDISMGGIACRITEEIGVGSEVVVQIDSVAPTYSGKGQVVWCKPCGSTYEVGVSFDDTDEAFKSRMVQQVCQIEQYKKFVLESEGRELDSNQAAAEWIKKYAKDFA